jgi:hypothetical protein
VVSEWLEDHLYLLVVLIFDFGRFQCAVQTVCGFTSGVDFRIGKPESRGISVIEDIVYRSRNSKAYLL